MVAIKAMFVGHRKFQPVALGSVIAFMAVALFGRPTQCLAWPPMEAHEDYPDNQGWGMGSLGGELASVDCGPVSAVYGMLYLQSAFPSYYDSTLAGSTPDSWGMDVGTLSNSNFMNTQQPDGTRPSFYQSGLMTWYHDFAISWATVRPTIVDRWTSTKNTDGTWTTCTSNTTIYDNIVDKEAVQILISTYNSITKKWIGHYVSVTAYSDDGFGLDTSVQIKVLDPLTATSQWVYLMGGVNGSPMTTTYSNSENYVTSVIIESPVPEPSTLILTGIAAISLLGFAYRRRPKVS